MTHLVLSLGNCEKNLRTLAWSVSVLSFSSSVPSSSTAATWRNFLCTSSPT